ncbi:MAG: ATP-dependent 6-phosphofructokinase [Deltaproteobacteria bacterium]|nr:ATP-dependent 6-phosphofructokinase [Deltaproteobacteria bacterium]
MEDKKNDLETRRLGVPRIPSPMTGRFIDESDHVVLDANPKHLESFFKEGKKPPMFEIAGPRGKIFFDPSKLKCGIVTCGGLCPGLNDVIRAIVMGLFYHYGVKIVFGFPYGFEGLAHKYAHEPVEFTPEMVKDIHQMGGTVLGSSRGPQDVSGMVDTLERMSIGILFTIGGDGTLNAAHAIAEEISRRNLKIGVIGVPKTIDNDISFTDMSFGFVTAVSEARTAIYSAHTEAQGARNGIGLVKLMGRESGFIAAFASISNGDVNFCLIPEMRFTMEAFLKSLQERLESRRHAVVVVGEGAGQDLIEATGDRDESGNIRFADIGLFLKERIQSYFKKNGMDVTLKYIDPSYTIRSMPANPYDSGFCLLLGHHAVHAGMAGKTDMVVSHWYNEFTHVPIPLAISKRKRIHPKSRLWSNVLSCTGQPKEMLEI